jgi:surface protein
MEMIYLKYKIDIKKNKKLKILGDHFVEKNKDLCDIIINNKELKLTSYIDIPKDKINQKYLDVKIKINLPLTSLKNMFFRCENLVCVTEFNSNTNQVTDISNMFFGCVNLRSVNLSNLNSSKIIKMSSVFKNCKSLQQISGIENFNTSNVTDMNSMFFGCSSLIILPDISNW